MKEYYEILGLTEEESKLQGKEFQDICKKKYRNLSIQWHPDKHVNDSDEDKKKAEETFKKISEAYTVLSDEKKRQEYDMDGFGGGFNPFEAFRNHMHGFGFDDMGFEPREEVGSDIFVNINLTINEAYSGVKNEIKFRRKVHCKECNGTGSSDGKDTTCPHCHGTGMVVETKQKGNMIFQSQHPCEHCHGTGKIVTNPCKKCNGTGLEFEDCIEYIEIPAGVFDGARMAIENKGNYPRGNGRMGNLVITIHIKKDNYYQIDGLNVVHVEKIPFNEVLLGCEREVKMLDGKTYKFKIPECTKDKTYFRQKGKGFPDVRSPFGNKGDFIVLIEYEYPNKLNNKQKEKLKTFYD